MSGEVSGVWEGAGALVRLGRMRDATAGPEASSCPRRGVGAGGRVLPYGYGRVVGCRGGRRGSRGQALLIAVLILFAVATLAALLAAIIGSQLAHVTRASDLVELRSIAEAGLAFANEQLAFSPEGADWRPGRRLPDGRIENRPYPVGRGWVRLDVSYGPTPDRLQTRFIRVVATAFLPDNPFLRHTVLALKPVLLTDYARFITDRFETNQPVQLGVTGVELGGVPRRKLVGEGVTDASPYVFEIEGPVRSNSDVVWHGPSRVNLTTRWTGPVWGPGAELGLLRDDRIEVSGRLRRDAYVPLGEVFALLVNGISRISDLYRPRDAERALRYSGCPDVDGAGNPIPNTERLLDGDYAVPRVRPPDIEAVHPDLETRRYYALTRDSGHWKQAAADQPFYNTGQFGWGWTKGGGIYIDNRDDIQYEHDLELLRMNWRASVGRHQSVRPLGDLRAPETGWPPRGPADWWDKTGRYYNPPGVEIILHGDRHCPHIEIIRHDMRGAEETPYYWQGEDGAVIPFDGSYTATDNPCSPAARGVALGVTGPRAIFPFPPNGVIYAEGNVRIQGIMPMVRGDPGTYWDHAFDAHAGRNRRFDLTVVSGGTIYIEGDLLTPRGAGLTHALAGVIDTLDEDARYGSRLALLARDYVCVNTTAFHPRPVNLFEAVPDPEDPEILHGYNDLQPIYPDYPVLEHPRHWIFQGTEADPTATDPPIVETLPPAIELVYRNVRLRNASLRAQLADLRLIVGHAAMYRPFIGTDDELGDPEPPPAPVSPTPDEPQVMVEVSLRGQVYPWEHGTNLYTFWRPEADAMPAPAGADVSGHWYHQGDRGATDPLQWPHQLEVLPNGYQFMSMHYSVGEQEVSYLFGDDLIRFESRVSGVRKFEDDGEGNLVPTGEWEVDPRELAYVLGPVAVAPPNPVYVSAETGWTSLTPLPVQIQALIYAQNGSWYIIPGPWFNDDPVYDDYQSSEAPGYREPLNIRISVYGAITENRPAPMGDVADWTSKWGGPWRNAGGFLRYEYDPLLRLPRRHWDGSTWVRFPGLALTTDLAIWGERVSGAAGG